ncbi:MAG: isoleucine--tRNA ligase, partial [Bacteriodetes bacterium]|nr:isoleucine--tRNA ligase [Bacteroidota bacterium]
ITVNNEQYDVLLEDVEILSEDIEGWLVASEGTLTVALDTELTAELIAEGTAREFVNRIQTLRKSSGFEVTDRIIISVAAPSIQQSLEQMREYICTETLATELRFAESVNGEAVDINDHAATIAVEKV